MIDRRKIILAAYILLAVIVAIVAFVIIDGMRFKMVGSSPTGDTFPSSSNELAFMFSKPLDAKRITKDNVTVSPAQDYALTVDNKTLKISFTTAPKTAFKVSVKNIYSTGGKIIGNVERSYKVKYVAYKDLTDYEKQRQVSISDNFSSTYPIIAHLPVTTDSYTITYKVPTGTSTSSQTQKKLILFITARNKTELNNLPVEYVRQAHQDALNAIKAMGFDPANYQILYEGDIQS